MSDLPQDKRIAQNQEILKGLEVISSQLEVIARGVRVIYLLLGVFFVWVLISAIILILK